MDGHRGLIVIGSGEHLLRLGRNGGVFLDELGHYAAQGLDAERKRRDIEQQHVFDFALQHAGLDCCADRHRFIRVDVLARLLAENLFHFFLYLGRARLAADQDHVFDVGEFHAGVLDRDLARLHGALDQFFNQALEFGAGDFDIKVLRPACIRRDVRQIDFGLLRAGELDLGFFRRFLEALQSQHIVAQINALLFLEFVRQVINHPLVEILTAEEGVAVGGQHLKLVLALDYGDLDDGNVESAAAQVVDRNLAVAFLFVQAESERRRGRLVDNALDFQPGDAPGILGRLALRVVEIGRHGDDRFLYLLAEIVLGGLFHFHQYLGGHFGRGDLLALRFDPGIAVAVLDDFVRHQANVFLHFFLAETPADQPLHCGQGVFRVGHRLALGRRAAQDFPVIHVGDDGRRGARAF